MPTALQALPPPPAGEAQFTEESPGQFPHIFLDGFSFACVIFMFDDQQA
jgi:hypothetical protein